MITWYDILGVEPSATDDELVQALADSMRRLGPDDDRADELAAAGRQLLNPATRREYDAWLDRAPATTAAPTAVAVLDEPAGVPQSAPQAPDPGRAGAVGVTKPVRGWVIGLAGVLAACSVGTAAYAWANRPAEVVTTSTTLSGGSSQVLTIEDYALAARAAAEQAVVPVLSYDYRDMDASEEAARAWLTPTYYDDDFAPLFAMVADAAPQVKAVVTAQVVESGIVTASPDRVQVLVFVDRPTEREGRSVLYSEQVTVTMVPSGDGWLVDGMQTTQPSA